MSPQAFTTLFLFAVAVTLLVKLTLMVRQFRHVRTHRDRVPSPFAETISADAHRKAADYTCARMRLAMIDVLTGALFAVALTCGGLLLAIHQGLGKLLGAGSLAHGVALLAALGILSWLV